MSSRTAEKVARIVEQEITKFCDNYDSKTREVLGHDKYKIERMFRVRVQQSEHAPSWWGVYVYTDGDIYEELYDYNNPKAFDNRDKIMAAINKKMKWRPGDHYFEHEGGGVMFLY